MTTCRPGSRPWLLAALLALAACAGAGSRTSRLDAGSAAYRAGEPVFVLDAVASVRDDVPGVDVYLGLPPASLVFRQTAGDSLESVGVWTVTVEQEGRAPLSRSPRDTVRVSGAAEARTPEPVWRVERFEVPPGSYVVRAVLEDEGSGRIGAQRVRVTVPLPTGAPALGGLRLEGETPAGPVRPVDVTSVPAGLDSLQAVVQATGVPDGSTTELAVVRVAADDTAARRLDGFTPSLASLVTRGVDLGDIDTVQVVRQTVLNPSEALDVVAPIPALGPGVYRARIRLVAPDGAPLDEVARLFVVRRRDYPLVTRLGDLVGPLTYLAAPGELDPLLEAETADELRRAFDRFWGQELDDRRLASATVRAYYERVEEANRLFATYKDGWKTDQGMLYVLLGPPSYVEATIDGERWSYALGGGTPSVFVFERTAGRIYEDAPFGVLTLERSRVYRDLVRRAQRQWRTGIVP